MKSLLLFSRLTLVLLFSNLGLFSEILYSKYVPEITITPSYLERKTNLAKHVSRRSSEKQQKILVSDALKEVPGIGITSFGSLNLQNYITLRGTNPEHTSVRIFGMEINDIAGGNRFDFSNIQALDFDQADVKNFSSESSIGGVIDLEPRQGQGNLVAALDLEGGSYHTRQIHNRFSGSKGKSDYYLSGHFLKSGDSSLKNHRLGNRLTDKGENTALTTRLGHTFNDVWKIDVFGSLNQNNGNVNEFSKGLPSISSDTFKNRRNFFLIKNHLKTFHHRWEHDLVLGWIQSHYKNVSQSNNTSYINQGQSLKGIYNTRMKFNDQELLTSLGTTEDQTRQNHLNKRSLKSHYGQLTYSNNWFPNLVLTGQGRLDKHQFFKNHATWFGAIRYFINPAFNIFVRYGTGFRAPTTFDFYKTSPYSLDNPSLKPVKSHNFDIGTEVRIFQNIDLSLCYFQVHIRDLLDTIVTPQGLYQKVNLNRRKIQGIEGALRYSIHKDIHLRAAYTLTQAHDQMTTTRTFAIRTPRHQIQSGLDITSFKNITLFGEISYRDSSKDTDFGVYPSKRVRLPSHVDIRLGGSYKMNDHTEITGRIENVLNRQKESIYGYAGRGLGCYLGLKLKS